MPPAPEQRALAAAGSRGSNGLSGGRVAADTPERGGGFSRPRTWPRRGPCAGEPRAGVLDPAAFPLPSSPPEKGPPGPGACGARSPRGWCYLMPFWS